MLRPHIDMPRTSDPGDDMTFVAITWPRHW